MGSINDHSKGMDNLSKWGIERVKNTTFCSSGIFAAKRVLDSGEHIIFSDNSKKIHAMKGGFFVVEYTSEEARLQDITSYETIKVSDIKLPKGVQLPILSGEFEYKGKSCLLLDAVEKLTHKESSLFYHGVIMQPTGFLKSADRIKKIVTHVPKRVTGLIKGNGL